MGNIKCSYPGDRSTGLGQSCSWAMPMKSKIEGKKAEGIFETENWGTERGVGALGSTAGSADQMEKTDISTVAVRGNSLHPISVGHTCHAFPPGPWFA